MKSTITKKDVAKRTAKIVNEKIYLTEKVVDGVFTALREFMEQANPEIRIEIRDFGVFEVKTTKPKPKARNPKTGEIIYVPARRKTHFKAGKLLKEVLKQPLTALPPRTEDDKNDWEDWEEDWEDEETEEQGDKQKADAKKDEQKESQETP
ncbi:MAG: integration host factor subunit beta [candidate division KSB1 bacterium]|nr:integration host factor subunit beta [candidate division KSB1 bacterium]MDZ7275466.1 integration host factor subunit beta [candidate division KSB1 bacterium]MDZ7286222.1 integration host factor subunit beta [candidate division KSB1 bacterium]MDZ7296448.1 integration host factor subunit beta [candidate division KSB1 bacterium]MDZ7307244.1 integration host factor subunit beta [candidate division KSB1 bacterium]